MSGPVSPETYRRLMRGVNPYDVRRGLRKAGPTPAGIVTNALALLVCALVGAIVLVRVLFILVEGIL